MISDPPNRQRPARWRPLATIAVCTFGGPLIGMVLLLVAVTASSALRNGNGDGLWMPMLALHPYAWLLAYFMGGIPALLGAITYVALDRFAPPAMPRVLSAMALGAAATALFLLTFAGNSRTVAVMTMISAAAAGIAAYLTRPWRYG